MRTARQWGVPHSTIRRGGKPRWSEKDRLLAVALTAFEDNLHPECGHPRDLTGNPDSEGWFRVRTWTCQACAELQRHQHDEKRPSPGTVVFVANEMPPGLKLRPANPPGARDKGADEAE